MAEQATQTTVIAAPPSAVWDALTDFEAYPSWVRDLRSATVVSRDASGLPLEVAFRAAAMGRSTSYTLHYEYRLDDGVLAWRQVAGDLTRRLDGSYHLTSVDDDRATEVQYHLEVELLVPLPGFVKRRAEARIFSSALRDLRAHLEA